MANKTNHSKKKTPKQIAQLKEASKTTRYGAEKGNARRQDIPGASAPYEVRNAYRALMRAPIDITKPTAVQDALKLITMKGHLPTGAMAVAAAMFREALKGNTKAAEIITDSNEGKLPETINVNSTGVVANLNAPLEGEELRAATEEMARFASSFKHKL